MNFSKTVRRIVALVIAAHLLVACGGDEPAKPATTSSENTALADPPAAEAAQPAAAAVSLPSDPKAAILQAMRAQLTAGPHRNTTTISMEGSEQTSVGLMIPPDKMHVSMEMDGLKTEMIYIGDKVWSKQGDEAWQASDRLGTPGAGLVGEEMFVDAEKTISEAALVGPEVVDGVDALRYSYTNDLNQSGLMPMESVQQVTLWINATSGLIIRQEITDATMGTPSKTVQVIEYDDSITIEPPVQ